MSSGRPGGPPAPPKNGDHSMGPAINAVAWTFTSISTLFVIARLYVRFRLVRAAGWDDFWIVISIILGIVYSAMSSYAISQGNGRHTYYLTFPQLMQALRWNSLAFPPGILSLAVPKLAVVALLQRLLNPNRWHLAFLWTLAISTVILIAAGPILLWTQCTPHDAIWNLTLQPIAHCIPAHITVDVAFASGALSAFADYYLAAYPIFIVCKLKMSLKQKIGLCMVMSAGFVAGSIAIYKTTTLGLLYDHSDYTYVTAKISIWTSVEANLIVIAACIPTLRPLYLQIMGRPQTQVGGSSSNPSHRYNSRGYVTPISKFRNANRKLESSKSSDTDIDLMESQTGHELVHDGKRDITKTVSVSVETASKNSHNPDNKTEVDHNRQSHGGNGW